MFPRPPSTVIKLPVMFALLGSSKNSAIAAGSSALPILLSGCMLIDAFSAASLPVILSAKGVSVYKCTGLDQLRLAMREDETSQNLTWTCATGDTRMHNFAQAHTC